jgi:GNAT superfamily N-acetyltransferase
VRIREYETPDEAGVLELVGRAWEPVFPEVDALLGPGIARLLHSDDWRAHHREEIRGVLADPAMTTWVADDDGAVVGVASARVVDPTRAIGEVHLVGVDPLAQRRGIGAALTRHAEEHLRAQGMRVSYISTGGDPGHARARELYSSLGYTLFPSAQFFKEL